MVGQLADLMAVQKVVLMVVPKADLTAVLMVVPSADRRARRTVAPRADQMAD